MDSGLLNRRWFVFLLCVALFATLVVLAEGFLRREAERLQGNLRARVLADAALLRARIEGELNSTLYLANGLSGYVSAYPTLEPERVDVVLSQVYRHGRHLRNIGLAPGNVIRFIYPLQNNEKAIGLRYEELPTQWDAVKRAIASRSTVLAGPVDLVQGGRGLISRTPVFLPNGLYWGLISVVVDADSFFAEVDRERAKQGFQWALRGKDGLAEAGDIVFGDAQLFEKKPVRLPIRIPGGTWEMAAAPAEGWRIDEERLFHLRMGALLLSLLVALLVHLALEERIHIRYLALHDTLTGLPNRRLLNDRLERAIAQAQRNRRTFAVLYVDLDGFKPVNDRYGHRAGDRVLAVIARRLQCNLRRSDTVARVGGDEFVLLLPDVGSQANALVVVEKITDLIAQPIQHGDQVIHIGASVGVSLYPHHGETPDALIDRADAAMFWEKRESPEPKAGAL
jgi:diguanylate cyclase (GGDEF)-like protein